MNNLFQNAVRIGGHHEYTKEDAFDRLNSAALKMDAAHTQGNAPPGGEAETGQSDGLTNEKDFFWAGVDLGFTASCTDQIGRSVDEMASRYAAMKDRIDAEFTGQQRTDNLNRLDKLMNQYKDMLAQNFADEVGGIFAEYTAADERDRLYRSVLDEVDRRAAEYCDWIQSGGEYAAVSGPQEAWLQKDSAYLASELRKAMAGAERSADQGAAGNGGYTLDEMEKMRSFANELVRFSQYPRDPQAALTGNETEESLGLKLAVLSLKGKVFNQYAGVSDRVKKVVAQSVDRLIAEAVEREQAYMNQWSRLQIEGTMDSLAKGDISRQKADEQIAAIRKGFAGIDRTAIGAVVARVGDIYDRTGDASAALMEGSIFALETYANKIQSGRYDGMHRYDDGGSYWRNFFVRPAAHTAGYSAAVGTTSSGIDAIINSWNRFMAEITADSGAFLKKPEFSAIA